MSATGDTAAETGRRPLPAETVFRFAVFHTQVVLVVLMTTLAWGRVVANNVYSFLPHTAAAVAALVVWVGAAAFSYDRAEAAAQRADPDGAAAALGREVWRLGFAGALYGGGLALLALLAVSAAFFWPFEGRIERMALLVVEGVFVLVVAVVLLKLAFVRLIRRPAVGTADYLLMGLFATFAAYFFYGFGGLPRAMLRDDALAGPGTPLTALLAAAVHLGAAIPLFLAGLLQVQDGDRRGTAVHRCFRRAGLCFLGLLIGGALWPAAIGVELVYAEEWHRFFSRLHLTSLYPALTLLMLFLLQAFWLRRQGRAEEAGLNRRSVLVTALSLAIAWGSVRLLQQAGL